MPKRRTAQRQIYLSLQLIGRVLRFARERLNYSYRQLAEKCDVSATQLLRMESGEFEYSALKLFNVCVTVGLPFGELMEYGTVRSFDLSGRIVPPAEIASLLESFEGHEYGERHEIFWQSIDSCFHAALTLLTCADPIGRAYDFRYSGTDEEQWSSFSSYNCDPNNVERIHTLRGLMSDPVEKLSALGLVEVEDLTQAIKSGRSILIDDPYREKFERSLGMAKSGDATPKGKTANAETVNLSVDIQSGPSSVPHMTPPPKTWIQLRNRLQKATKATGTKSELARELKVARQSVDKWLNQGVEPSAEITLRLLAWVTARGAKQ